MPTTNLKLMDLAASQANKEVVINEIFEKLDTILSESASVEVAGADPADVSISEDDLLDAFHFRLTAGTIEPVNEDGRQFDLTIPDGTKRAFLVTNDVAVAAGVRHTGTAAAISVVAAGTTALLYADGTEVLIVASGSGGGGGTVGAARPARAAR